VRVVVAPEVAAPVIVAPEVATPDVLSLELRATEVVGMTRAVAAKALGRWLEITPRPRRTRTVFRDVQAQGASTDFFSVQLLDRLLGLLLGSEPDEREAPGAPRLAVFRDVNVHDFPNLSEQRTKLLVRRCKVEVPYEYLA
jgi:hypothetical protein